jgi:DHA2 family multidrug resistance protein
VASILLSRIMNRFDPRVLAACSFGIFATSYFMRAGLTADAGVFSFIAPQLVQGVAMGLFFISLLAVVFDGLPPAKIPAASGMSNFMRITAGSFATSLTTTLWDRRETLHQSRLADTATVYLPALQQSLALIPLCFLVRRPAGGGPAPVAAD